MLWSAKLVSFQQQQFLQSESHFVNININTCHNSWFIKISGILLSACGNPVDVMFLLDSSGSVEASNFNDVKLWLTKLVEEFDVENDVADIGLISFSTEAKYVYLHFLFTYELL